MRVLTLIAAALVFAGNGLLARADQPAGILTHHGTIYQTKKAGMETEGFIEIDNSESAADKLTAVQCAIADSTSLVDAHGSVIDNLTVAAGKKLILTADGPHIFLQSTHFTIDHGGAIPCSLTFQDAGEVSIYLYPIPAP